MQCANYLCIYEKDGGCTLDGISLNIWGSCEECLYINVEEDELKRLKAETLKSVERINRSNKGCSLITLALRFL